MPAACSALTIVLNSCTCALRLGPDAGRQLAGRVAVTGHRVAVVRGEEGDRVVAPVVAQAALDEVVVVDELVDRHQLDGRDPEAGEVLDDGGVGDARVRAAHLLGHRRVELGEALHVGLVDDRVVHPVVRRAVVAPVEERVDDDGARHVRRAVGRVHLVRIVEVVGEAGRVPVDLAVDRLGVRVEQQLGRVAPQALVGLPGPVHPVAVALAGPDVGQVGVPAVAVDLGERDPDLGEVAVGPEQAQLDALGDAGEEREVGPGAVVGRAERVRRARPSAAERAVGEHACVGPSGHCGRRRPGSLTKSLTGDSGTQGPEVPDLTSMSLFVDADRGASTGRCVKGDSTSRQRATTGASTVPC